MVLTKKNEPDNGRMVTDILHRSFLCRIYYQASFFVYLATLTGMILSICQESIFAAQIVVLRSGVNLIGEVLSKDEVHLSLKTTSGMVIRVNVDEVAEILEAPDPEDTPEPVVDSATKEEPIRPLSLKTPTPTPVPVIPVDIRLEPAILRKMQKQSPFSDKGISSQSPTPSLEKQPDEKILRLGECFGRVIDVAGEARYRRSGRAWLPIRKGRILLIGDEINSLHGQVEIHHEKSILLKFQPESMGRLLDNAVRLEQGKIWVATNRKEIFEVKYPVGSVMVRNAFLRLDFLRQGYKVYLMEGQADLLRMPDEILLLNQKAAPVMLLISSGGQLVSESPIPESIKKDWKGWKSATDIQDITGTLKQGPEFLQLQNLANSISEYYRDHGRFPPDQEPYFSVLIDSDGDPRWNGPYIERTALPMTDAWGSAIGYRLIKDEKGLVIHADIFSPGPDRHFAEGEGDDILLIIPPPIP